MGSSSGLGTVICTPETFSGILFRESWAFGWSSAPQPHSDASEPHLWLTACLLYDFYWVATQIYIGAIKGIYRWLVCICSSCPLYLPISCIFSLSSTLFSRCPLSSSLYLVPLFIHIPLCLFPSFPSRFLSFSPLWSTCCDLVVC